ncbi:MAG: xanthine dehydrogenase family protein, partial [Chloroflexi bacterium]
MSAVGTPTRRLEGRDKVVGTTRYTADLDVAGLLHVQLVLSHLASARIRSIETSAARSVPGVVDVVVAGDLPDQDVAGPDQPLATERVFYAGQPVAAVIATSEAAAHDGAAAVEVDLEETEVVADAETAMQDGSPVVLDVQEEADEGDASMHGAAAGNESEPVERPRNVSAVASTKRGDASAAMAGSDVTVKATYSVAAVHHTAMEPHVSTVRPEPGGGMTVWSPTQGPFALRDELADKLDIPAHKIRVVPMPVGGGFGGKVSLLEGLLALLAIRANRPLRLVLTRRQVFAFAKGAPAARFEIEIGAKKDGTLTALRAKFSYDNGASAGWHGGISSAFLAGTYRWPAVDITGYEVSTNKTPVDAYRAPGAPQTYFALESAMDELAQKLDIDPIELRLR